MMEAYLLQYARVYYMFTLSRLELEELGRVSKSKVSNSM